MNSTMTRRALAGLTATAMLLASCGGDDAATTTTQPSVTTGAPVTEPMPETSAPETTVGADDGFLTVPTEFATIQEAVDAAAEGEIVYIEPGTYNEAVSVTTNGITIRGADRNTVVLDGQFELENGIRALGSKDIVVENLTSMNYTKNGVFVTGVDGYRISYVTAYRTGDYGVYAFDSVNGQIDHIYAAGSPDAGIYIGECFPCNAVVSHVVSEHNGLGYSGTNSGGDLYIVESTFRYNRAGIVPNSGSYELCYPERQTTIIGNLVHSNNQGDTPAIDVALLAMGNGILVAGGVDNLIERNRVWDHDKTGIGLAPFPEDDPNDELPTQEEWDLTCEESKQVAPVDPGGAIIWDSWFNTVRDNVLEDNRQADLMAASVGTDVSTLGHCFSGNTFTTSAPNAIETLAPCDGTGSGDWMDNFYNIALWLTETPPPSVDWKVAELPALETQESMPDAATAPAVSAAGGPAALDLASIGVPDKP
jgi:hypothetical protein